MKISLIVAQAENRVIGRGNGLPWHLPDDLKRFKSLTLGNPVLLGRRTFESIGRLLPGRTNVILTRDPGFRVPDAVVVNSFAAACEQFADAPELFVAGGEAVYRTALPLADRLYITDVLAEVEGDVYFPEIDWNDWRLIREEQHPRDAKHEFPFRFRVYDRIRQPLAEKYSARLRASSKEDSSDTLRYSYSPYQLHEESTNMAKEDTQDTVDHLLDLSQRLLDTIAAGDWAAYSELCDPTLSCFEPEARGLLVEGLDFHRFYFDLGPGKKPRLNTLASPHVRLLGRNAAVVSYVRLVQFLDAHGTPQTASIDETRVWEKQDGRWRHVHFHRSVNA